MLNKLNIGPRLVLLIAIQTVMLLVIGITSITGLNFAASTTTSLNTNVIEQVKLNQLNETIRVDILYTINDIASGRLSWDEGDIHLASAKNLFVNNWDEYKEDRTPEQAEEIKTSLGNEYDSVILALDKIQAISEKRDNEKLSTFIEQELNDLINPFILTLNERVNEQQLISEGLFQESINKNNAFLYNSIIIMIVGLVIASILGFLIYRSISRPVKQISTTVGKVANGDYYARTEVSGDDELGELGQAFDDLLEDKVATLVQAEKDNEILNESIISVLQAVSQISKRDLTIRVPVTEDITGPVADALNQLTSETSKVLLGVRRFSEEVAKSSTKVQAQSETVIAVATDEQTELDETTEDLAQAIETMDNITMLAQVCDSAAEEAINTTHTALDTVTDTIEGINDIREVIHETEKRIKRLGERSQEITRAVNLINTIAERTHILALNASMHAASAGEAGRGFAVVADEVQRLSENATDATSQIATLVSNIQIETSDTVTTMNNLITQVVDGSKLAEMAGDQMRKTKDSTTHLVESVRLISKSTDDQARISNKLQHHASQIQESSRKTMDKMQEQTQQTKRLVQYAGALLKAVRIFKLPELQVISNKDIAADHLLDNGMKQKKVS